MERIGEYEVLGSLGQGAMGSVYRARHPGTGAEVAIKLLSRLDDLQQERFQREAEALARLRHRNVVGVRTLGRTARDQPYLVLDLVEGPSLDRLLETEGPLPIRRAVELTWQLAQGLAHAHEQGVLHRDLKPSNVLVAQDGRPLLTDFGLAKRIDTSRTHLTQSGWALGTPGFWPPEQARGRLGDVGPASDVYGLGAILYALLTGQPPVDGESFIEIMRATLDDAPTPPSKLRPEVGPRLERLVLQCLEKDPAQRPASARALADALDEWLVGGGSAPSPHRKALVLGGLLGVAALALGGALLSSPPPAPAPAPPEDPATTPAELDTPEPAPARQLWPARVGATLRFRLLRKTAHQTGDKSSLTEFEFSQRVKSTGERAVLELVLDRLRVANLENGIPLMEYDTAAAPKVPLNQLGTLHQQAQAVLGSKLRVALEPATGRIHEVTGLPRIDVPGRGQGAQLVRSILAPISNRGVFGCLQTAWEVLPEAPGDAWNRTGQVWPAGGIRYWIRRSYRARGQRIAIRGRAKAKDVLLPETLNTAFRVSGLDARGELRFSERGLERSEHRLRYEVLVGDYPGKRETTIRYERLD